ncbi:MAG TPA: methyltransferase domain-containing protein [Actinomycetes bacterium]|nr:methyltransferase domain-containing protein [Actinomycetes bacterium]
MSNEDFPSAAHWDGRHRDGGVESVSWFEANPWMSVDLISLTGLDPSTPTIDVGGGASRLVDRLLGAGWSDVTVLDVSQEALDSVRARLAAPVPPGLQLLRADLRTWTPDRRYGLWHDRAVFHFLVEEQDRHRYRQLLSRGLAADGVVVIGTFAADGPTQCSGRPVARYDAPALLVALGGPFDVLAERRETHRAPDGALQPFTWLALRARQAPAP